MLKNIFFLFLIQISNYIFPLLTLPYLVRVLGASQFGSLMLAQALIQYFITVTEYGFNLSATKKIALSKSQDETNKIYTNTLYARIILALICFIIAILCTQFIKMFEREFNVIIILFLGVIGNCFFPIYLFQGLELMKKIAWISIVSKTFMTLSVFVLVKDAKDINNAALALAIPLLLPGIISFIYIYNRQLARVVSFSFRGIVKELKDGGALFISQIAISFYTTFNTLILGYIFNPTIVGVFSAADKLRIAAQSCYVPIQQVVFPRINKEAGELSTKLLKYGGFFVLISFLGSSLVFFFGEQLALLYLGNEFIISARLFKWMSLLLFIISIAIVFGQWGLITLGKEKLLTKIYVIGALCHVGYSIPLVMGYNVYGMLVSVLITEFIITLMMIFSFYKVTHSAI